MFLKIAKNIILIVAMLLCLHNSSLQAANTLSIEYLDKFPGNVGFDSKYEQVDKYLVYKYLTFSFVETLEVNSADLNFVVDSDWYKNNGIEDVIFLRYDNNNWDRISYNNKSSKGNYIEYQVTSDTVGQYWAIIGVLPTDRETLGALEESEIRKDLNDNIFNTFGQLKQVDEIVKISKDVVLMLKEPTKVKGASSIATTTATISAVSLLVLIGGPTNLLILLEQMGLAFFGLFFLKKRHRSGIIYDVNTGIPVALARIDLIDKKSNKTKATKFTNKEGKYYFLAPEGKYRLGVRKKGYSIIEDSKAPLFKALFNQSDLEAGVNLSKSGVVEKNVAILKQDKDSSYGKTKTILMTIIGYLANVAFLIGLVFSFWVCYIDTSFFSFVVLAVYILILLFRTLFIKKQKYGTVLNSNGKPEAFATINVLDAKTNETVSRVISNTKGQYYILLEKGNYILNIKTVGGVSISKKIRVMDKNILFQKLIIKK